MSSIVMMRQSMLLRSVRLRSSLSLSLPPATLRSGNGRRRNITVGLQHSFSAIYSSHNNAVFSHQQQSTRTSNYRYVSASASTTSKENDNDNENDDEQLVQQKKRRHRFDELDIHRKSLKALHRHGLYKLTEIQEKSYDVIVSGKDVVGRARTGTGKTLSFLLPALERIVRSLEEEDIDDNFIDNDFETGIRVLILSPTRELAIQIGKEAERLVAQHHPSITSQVIYGGSSKQLDIDQFNNYNNNNNNNSSTRAMGLPTILVATPGRLKDHLASTRLKNGKLFIDAVQNLQTLVLDETDRLLDMGFRRDIQDILACLPSQQQQHKRQTLLFSATIPPAVQSMIETTVRSKNYTVIDCIQEEDPATHTNAQTEQSHVVLPAEQFWSGSIDALLKLMDENDSSSSSTLSSSGQKGKNNNKNKKIMVFFPMTSLVQLYSDIFNLRFGRRVLELHGKMYQRERTTISRRFRNSNNGILFTSDVSARGVDYPNVTHVVQIGAADSRETYIHRLGRTGRAGKQGKGLLILPELERSFLKELEGLDLPRDAELNEELLLGSSLLSGQPSRRLTDVLGPLVQEVGAGRDPDIEKRVNDAYQAMIAFYFQRYKNKTKKKNKNKNNDDNIDDDKDQDGTSNEIVSTINSLVENLGLRELPAIEKRRAEKIGVDTLPGINITQRWSDQNWSGSWGTTPPPKKPFGMPYGDFEGKFSPSSGRGRGRGDTTGNNNNINNNARQMQRGGGGGGSSNRDHDDDWYNDREDPRNGRSSSRGRDDRNGDLEGSNYRNLSRRRDDWERSPPRRRDDWNNSRDNSTHRSSPRRRGSSMDRPQRGRRETPHHGDRSRPMRRRSSEPSREQFAKVGWTTVTDFKALQSEHDDNKNNKGRRGGGPPPRKKGPFQRWENPGEYNFKN